MNLENFVKGLQLAQQAVDKIMKEHNAMSTHTPGPWEDALQRGIPEHIVMSAGGNGRQPELIASIAITSVEGEECANTRLIALAPAMLEALCLLYAAAENAAYTKGMPLAMMEACEQARALLAQIEEDH